VGLGFLLSLFHPLPALGELERLFRAEAWPGIEGAAPAAVVHRIARPRGGNIRALSWPFGEAINQAMWDLAAKQAGLPLWRMLGGTDPAVRTYASGLDFHLSDADYVSFFRQAAARGHRGFKIKVGICAVGWEFGGVVVNTIANLVGVSLIFKYSNKFKLLFDVFGGLWHMGWSNKIKSLHSFDKIFSVEISNFPRSFAFAFSAFFKFVFAVVGIAHKMSDIGNIHDTRDI
jgi:hypothetical protein